METERRKFYKKFISYRIFFNNKMFSTTYLQSFFFLPNPDACDLQAAVSNFAVHGHELILHYWYTQQAESNQIKTLEKYKISRNKLESKCILSLSEKKKRFGNKIGSFFIELINS